MAVLLAVVWGENATPGKGWLQDRFKEIQFRRAAYERGRQLGRSPSPCEYGWRPD